MLCASRWLFIFGAGFFYLVRMKSGFPLVVSVISSIIMCFYTSNSRNMSVDGDTPEKIRRLL